MDLSSIMASVDSEIFGVWFLIGAALVFWMQAGFAMVETGFTRAKNTGNILMKNLMDFCIGTVMFILIGFSLLLGEDLMGFIGKPGFDIFTAYPNFDFSNFVFNLVFCATTATIVSGAMAERTKFLSYCVYSAVISALIYPIEAHWIWGGGWLSQLGFHDYAGSCAIHMVGGLCALIGAKMVGPRIGKFSKDKSGKIVGVNAFPGHNIPLGCLGVFILWLGGEEHRIPRLDFPDDDGCAVRGDSCLHDFHLGALRQAGCVDVPERLSGGSGRHHGGLRRAGLHGCHHRRRCLRSDCQLRRVVLGQQAACG